MIVQNAENNKIYQVLGTYFDKEKGVGRVYLGDMNGKPIADADLETFMEYYMSIDHPSDKWEDGDIPTVKSKLANLEVALTDYFELSGEDSATVIDGKKKYFTHKEALQIQENLKDSGWRLPTRSEWALLCEEFGQDSAGRLSPDQLENNLRLVRGGYVGQLTRSLRDAGGSYYWSATTSPNATYAYDLNFGSTSVDPSYYNNRFNSFLVRLVRDIPKEKKND